MNVGRQEQCDQIGRFIGLWATLATINLSKPPTFLGNFSREIILGNFYRHLAIFSGHTVNSPN